MDVRRRIQEIEYEYWLDKRELGKTMIVASLALLIVSVHAIYTVNSAVKTSQDLNDRVETTAAFINSTTFESEMNKLADTGATIGGKEIDQIVADLRYATNTVEKTQSMRSELENARKTYQWTALIGILGLAAGLTTVYV